MLKKDVWELFKTHAGGTIHDEWRFVGEEADELCGAIAQAAEEDKAEELAQLNRGWRASECARLRTIAELRAQVGAALSLADGWEQVDEEWGEIDPKASLCACELREALSAAPKVVWRGRNVASTWYRELDGTKHIEIISAFATSHKLRIEAMIDDDIADMVEDEVEVFVTASRRGAGERTGGIQ